MGQARLASFMLGLEVLFARRAEQGFKSVFCGLLQAGKRPLPCKRVCAEKTRKTRHVERLLRKAQASRERAIL